MEGAVSSGGGSGAQVSPQMREFLLWLVGGTIAFLLALNWLPIVFLDGELIPAGPDAFYHARRILDTVEHPGGFYQFDPRIHAPEGSWLVWPWGFDFAAAWFVKAVLAVTDRWSAQTVLAYLPPLAVYVNVFLIVWLTAQLRLHTSLRLLSVLCFAVSPLTQLMHAVGRIDHHFAEYTVVLLALNAGVAYAARPASRARGALLGFVLGLAVAFHSNLFVLQLPLVAWALVSWWRRIDIDRSTLTIVAMALLVGAAIAVVPSAPFRNGEFAFHTLSWFHFYVAGLSAFALCFCAFVPPSPRTAIVFAVVSAVLCVPLQYDVLVAYRYLDLELPSLENIREIKSPFRPGEAGGFGWRASTEYFSALLWWVPIALVVLLWQLVRSRDSGVLYFALFSLMGGALLAMQFRFHFFVSHLIFLGPALVAQPLLDRFPGRRTTVLIAAAIVAVVAYLPAVPRLFTLDEPSLVPEYVLLRPLWSVLNAACERAPGVVLASHRYGHFVRYHSECSVIGNPFLLTPLQARKIAEGIRLFESSADKVRDEAPWIRYVLVSFAYDPSVFDEGKPPRLIEELLLKDSPAGPPAGYRLIGQAFETTAEGRKIPVGRLFEIMR